MLEWRSRARLHPGRLAVSVLADLLSVLPEVGTSLLPRSGPLPVAPRDELL